jgi:hypothetical protein
MQIENSNSHKYYSNSNIKFEIQIYIHFRTEILILNNKLQNSNINF